MPKEPEKKPRRKPGRVCVSFPHVRIRYADSIEGRRRVQNAED